MTRNDVFAKKGLIREIQDRQFLYFPLLHEQWVVALATEADLIKLQREGSAILNLQNFCIGVSMPMANLSAMFSRYQQAKFAMEQSEAKAGIWLCEDFSFHYLLSILRAQELTPSLLHPALEQLEQYDKENQGELRQTLSVYLKKEQNHVPAANELHIHTNTLKYRLRRIRELTGLTLTDEAELRYLQLSDWISKN